MKKLSNSIKTTSIAAILSVVGLAVTPAHAISESSVQSFATQMSRAANSQNIGAVSQLLDDKVIISLTRKGQTATLDKNAYLQLLQQAWAGASDYKYNIKISDVIITGDQARATVSTTETWMKSGKRTTLTTTSKATLNEVNSNAVLLRSVSQATVD